MSTLYTVLGLPETATDEQIKQAYRALAKKYHPDLHPGDTETAKKFSEVNLAMETLGNPAKRKEYDDRRKAEKKQAEARAEAAKAAAANAAAAKMAAARAAASSRPYMGTAAGAQAVIGDTYRKGYNEGFAAGQAAAMKERNSTAETWKKAADNWKKEAEKYQGDVDILKTALEKARQRAADAEASARRMEASLRVQTSATEEARRGIDSELAAKETLRVSYEEKLNVEREARKYSDADKVRLSREVVRLKEENSLLREKLGKYEKCDEPAEDEPDGGETILL